MTREPDSARFQHTIRMVRWLELLGVAAYAMIESRSHPHIAWILALCAAMAVYSFLADHFGRADLTSRSSITAVCVDFTFVSVVVAATGGAHSFFYGLFFLLILGTAVWYGLRGAMTVATLAFALTMAMWFLNTPVIAAQLPSMAGRLSYLFLIAWLAGTLTDAFRHESGRRIATERASERTDSDLQAARQMQESMLPRSLPIVPGLEVAVRYLPAGAVGGDIYDFVVTSPPAELCIIVADVSGHSLPAALLTVAAKSAWRDAAGMEPLGVVAAVNRHLVRDAGPDQFMTMVYARIDPTAKRIRWVTAGHPPGVILNEDREPEVITGGGWVVGISESADHEERTRDLETGDVVIFFSDGLIERQAGDGSRLDLPEFLALLKTKRFPGSAEEIADGVLKCADQLGKSVDDLVLVVCRLTPESVGAGTE